MHCSTRTLLNQFMIKYRHRKFYKYASSYKSKMKRLRNK